MVSWYDENLILDALVEFKPRIYKRATTGSLYIKFELIPHSLRVGDHKGIRKYRYRWNLRDDITESFINMNGHEMRHYPLSELETMVQDMHKYYFNKGKLK